MARPSQGISHGVVVRATVPQEVNEVIDSLVAASGVSKATFVRQALFAGLEPYGLMRPELTAELAVTKHAGTTNSERK